MTIPAPMGYCSFCHRMRNALFDRMINSKQMSTKAAAASIQRVHRKAGPQAPSRRVLAEVVREIGLRIVKGNYSTGKAMPIEPALMLELGISRTVLREAIKTLTAKGLIESRGKLGTLVRDPKYWNLLDPTVIRLYCEAAEYSTFARAFQQIRAIIEPEAAALAAERHTSEHLKGLETAFAAMQDAEDIDQWTAADLNFHEAILDATGNPFMRPLGALISTALQTLLFHSAENATDFLQALSVHGRVLDGIRKRDPDKARTAMKTLLSRTALFVSKSINLERRRRRTTSSPILLHLD